MRDGPTLTAVDSHVPMPKVRDGVRPSAVSRPLKTRLRAALSAATRYDSWVWRLALVLGVAAYGVAMAIAMSAHAHV